MDDVELLKTVSVNKRRIDSVYALVHVPVPPGEFESTKNRIQREMAILKAHGEKPETVNCAVADKILQNADAGPDRENIRDLRAKVLTHEKTRKATSFRLQS